VGFISIMRTRKDDEAITNYRGLKSSRKFGGGGEKRRINLAEEGRTSLRLFAQRMGFCEKGGGEKRGSPLGRGGGGECG